MRIKVRLRQAALVLTVLSVTILGLILWRRSFPPESALEIGERSQILFGERARPLFQPCSRPAPAQIEGFWSPTADDIRRLEATLPAFLKAQPRQISASPQLPLVDYYKQYAGFYRSGQRMITLNAVDQIDQRWLKQEAEGFCDGGDIAFGAEYDVASGRFSEFHFNGALR